MHRLARIACALIIVAAFAATAKAVPPPEDDLLTTLVGTWNANGSAAGKPTTGTLVFKWGHGKSCVVSEYTVKHGGEVHHASHIVGFDSHTKSFRVLAFWSHGMMEDFHYKKESDGVYKGIFAGSEGGVKFEGELTMTVSKQFFKVETRGLKLGGEPIPELAVTFNRADE